MLISTAYTLIHTQHASNMAVPHIDLWSRVRADLYSVSVFNTRWYCVSRQALILFVKADTFE
jgi:hypothetical protein